MFLLENLYIQFIPQNIFKYTLDVEILYFIQMLYLN